MAPRNPAVVLVVAICLTACSSSRSGDDWFGDSTPPATQTLTFDNFSEPSSIDPAKCLTASDAAVVGTLFEGLVQNHPLTAQPIAALATHYTVSPDGKVYVFYLRGHPNPRGVRLEDSASLPADYSHGTPVPADSIAARWSDGTTVTAHDFVYAWRRVVDPRTAASYPDYMLVVKNAAAIMKQKRAPQDLGVAALDDFTFSVELEEPAPYLLSLLSHTAFRAVPRHALEKTRSEGREDAWWRSSAVVTNGPFRLTEWRPYDYIRVHRSATYYQSSLVRLDEITFLPVSADSLVANLFRAGATQAMLNSTLPETLVPALLRKKDFHSDFNLGIYAYSINTHRPPFDNVLVRYALNMAIDKAAIAAYVNSPPAKTMLTKAGGYEGFDSLLVSVNGHQYDVLAYNPAAAKRLLALAGYPNGIGTAGKPLAFDLRVWNAPNSIHVAEIMARHWLTNLNIEARLNPVEYNVAITDMRSGEFDLITDV